MSNENESFERQPNQDNLNLTSLDLVKSIKSPKAIYSILKKNEKYLVYFYFITISIYKNVE